MHAANETTEHTPKRRRVHLFPWEEGVVRMVVLNSCVPIMFSSVPNEIPQVSNSFLMMMFLKFSMNITWVFPIAPHFIPYTLPEVMNDNQLGHSLWLANEK
jgi:hypothetical protein